MKIYNPDPLRQACAWLEELSPKDLRSVVRTARWMLFCRTRRLPDVIKVIGMDVLNLLDRIGEL